MKRLSELTNRVFPSVASEGCIGSIDFNILLAQLCGLPLIGFKQEARSQQWVLRLYGIFMIALFALLYTGCEIYDLVLRCEDLDELTQNACLSLTHMGGLTKLKIFVLGELENKFGLLIYSVLVGFTGLLGIAMLLNNPQKVAGQLFPYRVALPVWLPFSLQLAYMGFSAFIVALQIVAIDYLNMNLINQIRTQLKVLNASFDELMLDGIVSNSYEILLVPAGNHYHNERLNAIIEHHCLLMRLRRDIEAIFRFPMLVQFFTSLVTFALTGFQAIVSTDESNGAVLLYFYCGCIFFELFIYCWSGNIVYEQSLTLSMSGYTSSWYQFDQRFKRSLLIFLKNAQRPFVFTAGGFFSISLPTFTNILTKSYTYIAVLQNLYSR